MTSLKFYSFGLLAWKHSKSENMSRITYLYRYTWNSNFTVISCYGIKFSSFSFLFSEHGLTYMIFLKISRLDNHISNNFIPLVLGLFFILIRYLFLLAAPEFIVHSTFMSWILTYSISKDKLLLKIEFSAKTKFKIKNALDYFFAFAITICWMWTFTIKRIRY